MRRPVAIALGWSVLVGVCSILAYVAIGDGDLLSARAEGESPQVVDRAARTPPPVNVLVSAADGRLVRGRDGVTRLILQGLEPQVEMFDTSPRTARMALAPWVWAREWRRLYRQHEPNATIVWRTKTGRQALSVSLASGSLDGGRMSFAVRRLATGSKRALPITARILPKRVSRLGRVDLFVDPLVPGSAQSMVEQALIALAGIQVGKLIWNVDTQGRTVSPPANGTAYKSLTTSAASLFLIVERSPAFASANLPGVALTVSNESFAGGYFENANLVGGSLTIGASGTNNVFVAPDLSGGSLVLTGGASGNMIVRGDFTNARITLDGIGRNNVFVTPTFANTALAGRFLGLLDTAFLGADMSGLNLAGGTDYDFSGATFAPYTQQTASGGTVAVNTAFDGMELGSQVSLSGGELTGYPSIFQDATFVGTIFDGTVVRDATITGGDFTNASLGGVMSTVDFTGSTFTGCTFDDANILRANFSNATLQQADFTLANFGDSVSFRGATLSSGTAFTAGGAIEQADFTGAIMDGVVFARGNGTGPTPSFIGQLLTQIADTTPNGLFINNEQYVKSDGNLFQIIDAANGGTQWQPVSVGGGPDFPVSPNGPPIDPPGPDPGPDPDPDGSAGPAAIQASFG